MKKLFSSALLVLAVTGSVMAVNCRRSIQSISANEVKVEIVINKDQLSSFARLAESIPEGSTIKYAKSEGGRLTIQDNKVKIIWLTLPQQTSITISYIVSTEALKEGNYTISGNFSYVDGGLTKEFEIPANNFTINGSRIASTLSASASEAALINKVMTGNIFATTNVTYAIQILSTKDKLSADHFSKNKVQQVKVETTTDGTNKYIMGAYKSSDEAIATRDSLVKKGFNDAFVVAYNNNQRITLEEAKQLEAGK
ncbi:MAG: SPOR domain-containing protein [Bacteroidetes bacterium]|nr:SPOR domain-containing protein [Bacteroidota bacterium]